jgi:sortase A
VIVRIRGSSRQGVMRSKSWRLAQRLLLLGGSLALSFVAYTYVARAVYQAYQSWKFDRALASSLKQPGKHIVQPPTLGRGTGLVIGRITIPRLKITAVVSEGIDDTVLGLAVGHIPYTSLPGRPGNVGLAAHRDTLFRNLKSIRPDDEITLTTLQGAYVYRVVWFKVVSPKAITVLQPSDGEETVTLVTCYPFYFVGHAPKRFVVRARRVQSVPQPEPL